MNVRTRACALLLTASVLLPAAAIDYGGFLSNSVEGSGHTNGKLDFIYNSDLTGWVTIPFNKDGTTKLAAEGTVSYQYFRRYQEAQLKEFSANLDLFKFTHIERSADGESFVFSAGRFDYADATGTIFNQTCDALSLEYKASNVNLGLYGGYTGLLNQRKVYMLDENGNNYVDTGDDDCEWHDFTFAKYSWAAPYFISSFSLSFPHLFANQTFGIEASSFLSTVGPSDIDPNYNRFYMTFHINGPLSEKLFYSFSTTFGTERFVKLGNLSLLDVTYYPNYHNASLSVRGMYASGDDQGPFDSFRGFTSTSATYARYAPECTGLLRMGLAGSLKPLERLYTAAGADIVFSCPANTATYDGWQCYLNIVLQCTNDFQISLTEYRYYGDDSSKNNGGATLKAILSF